MGFGFSRKALLLGEHGLASGKGWGGEVTAYMLWPPSGQAGVSPALQLWLQPYPAEPLKFILSGD